MIQARLQISGQINGREKLSGGLNTSIKEIKPELENIKIIPKTEQQEFKSEKYGYDKIIVEPVTSSIDEDIKPENIKKGTNILGVEGGYEGIDTSDATATPDDILQGKTAYANNKKMIGRIEEYDGTYTGNGETESEWEVFYKSMIDGSYGQNITKLPKGITTIGNYAFYYRSNLTLTELPESVTSIGNSAFANCSKLTISKLPKGLTSLGNNAFYGTPITISEIPEGINVLSPNCFQKCNNITSIKILGDVITFDSAVFNNASNLEEIILPNITNVPRGTSNMIANTKISNGKGYIYVPDSLVDSFKSASYWSTYANQIKPISELEV